MEKDFLLIFAFLVNRIYKKFTSNFDEIRYIIMYLEFLLDKNIEFNHTQKCLLQIFLEDLHI